MIVGTRRVIAAAAVLCVPFSFQQDERALARAWTGQWSPTARWLLDICSPGTSKPKLDESLRPALRTVMTRLGKEQTWP